MSWAELTFQRSESAESQYVGSQYKRRGKEFGVRKERFNIEKEQ